MKQPLSSYRIFYTVACEGNISRAAQLLYISQPAISKAIRRLEEALDTQLFLRSSRGVRLTDAGQVLFAHVRQAFEALNAGEEEIKKIHRLGLGHLRIGVSTTLCKYLLLPYLKAFIRAFPHIRISIFCQSTGHTIQLLNEKKIDIGLIGAAAPSGPCHFEPLESIQDIFTASPEYLENLSVRQGTAAKNPFETATLMLLDHENLTRQYIDTYLRENHILPENLLEVTTMDLLIDFAKIGLGIACVIRSFVREELASGELVEIPIPFEIPSRQVGFLYSSAAAENPALDQFLSFCSKRRVP